MVKAQQISENELKAFYINTFANYTIWSDLENIDTFKIGLIVQSKELYRELELIRPKTNIYGKPFIVSIIKPNVNEIVDKHIIYIDEYNLSFLDSLSFEIEYKKLIISDKEQNSSKVFINLLPINEESIGYEVNKPNILNAGLKVKPEILIYGGTEVDVAKVFKETMDTLVKQKTIVLEMQKELLLLKGEVSYQKEQINQQEFMIRNQIKTIDNREKQLDSLSEEYKHIKVDIELQRIILKKQLSEAALQTEILNHRESDLALKQLKINENNEIIEHQLLQIQQHKELVSAFEKEVFKQDNQLKSQNRVILLSIIIIVISLGLVFVVLIAYRSKVRANNKIKLAQAKLLQSEKMASLGVLTAGIAHEINNPINFVSSGICSLKQNIDDLIEFLAIFDNINTSNIDSKIDEIKRFRESKGIDEILIELPVLFSSIQKGSDRTIDIIRGLKTFSRLEENSLKLVDIHENIDSTLLILKNEYKNRIKILKNYNEIPNIEGYPGKINQVFMNILSNSIDAIKDTGSISIETTSDEINVNISIKDTGEGISEKTKKHIFEPFFTTKEVGKGTGLGLYISYNIILEHNGNIEVESEKNVGTTMKIIIPIKQPIENGNS